jgi:hypothetical protein
MDSQSQSPPTGVKKPRKPPQQISNETWKAIETAICTGGCGFSETGRRFGVEPHAIMGKAKRNNWPLPSVIHKRVEALQRSVTERAVCEANRHCNEQAIEAVAESWAQKAERHRALAFDFAHGALRTASKAPPPIESRRDIDVIDRCARRNAGLDDSERNQTINIGMQMVEARLLSLELPRDALPNMPGSEPPVPLPSP